MNKGLWLLFWCCMLVLKGNAQSSVVIDQPKEIISLNNATWVLNDKKDKFRIEEVENATFTPSRANTVVFERNVLVGWAKFTLKRQTDEALFFEVSNPTLDTLLLYTKNTKGDFNVQMLTESIVALQRDVVANNYIFELDLPRDSTKTFYLYMKTAAKLESSLHVGTLKAFMKNNHQTDFFHGIYFGFILLIILYNFFVFLSTRDLQFLLYIIYVIFLAITLGHFTGSLHFFFGQYATYLGTGSLISASLAGNAALFFCDSFLRLRQINKKMFYPFYVLHTFFIVAILLVLGGAPAIGYVLFQANSMLMLLYCFSIGAYFALKNYRPAQIYVLALGAFTMGVGVTVLRINSIVPYNIFTFYALQVGSLIEITLFSLALADKLNTYRIEKEKAQQQTLKNLEEHKTTVEEQSKMLEEQVKDRTSRIEKQKEKIKMHRQILDEQNARLEELMITKDKFFSIIAHDLKSPLNSLKAMLNLMSTYIDSLSKEEIASMCIELDAAVKNTQDLLNNLLHWAGSQTGSLKYEYTTVSVNELINEHISLFSQGAKNKNINLKTQLKGSEMWAVADRNSISTVLRNLISNALKYTFINGEITVGAEWDGDRIKIFVKDSGTGIPAEARDKIFELGSKQSIKGTANEIGTGLGLILSKEFVEKNKGTIWFETQENEGTTFYFTLPVANNETN